LTFLMWRDDTASLRRPLCLRALSTFRPLRFFMRARKPCFRARRRFLG
jgi:hypothetical protein